jgi:phosphate transport system permease protein
MAKLISETSQSHRKRMFKDKLAGYLVGLGGVSVIFAIALIFFYFLYVVIPLFQSADVNKEAEYTLQGQGNVLAMSMEEQTEIGTVFSSAASIRFFNTNNGEVIKTQQLTLPDEVTVSSFSQTNFARSSAMFGLSNGHVIAIKHQYDVSYPNDKRLISPRITFPLGEAHIVVDHQEQALLKLAFQDADDEATVVALTADKRLLMLHFSKETSLLD